MLEQKIADRLEKEYSVGPLLYMPALRTDIAQKLTSLEIPSAAICLEDTIRDDMVEQAEDNLALELKKISPQSKRGNIYIRLRNAEHIDRLFEKIGDSLHIINGIIIPKADDESIEDYLSNEVLMKSGLYLMPIIENPSLVTPSSRYRKLEELYRRLMEVRDRVLNVRIGGNDFCRALMLRADIDQTIYDLLPIGRLVADIAAVFVHDFTVSAPVWNYFEGGGKDWKSGLVREMKTDRSIGLVGKTVIHPSQIPVVMEQMKIPRSDYEDALLLAESNGEIQVIKSSGGGRMYENKIHMGWAEKTLCLAKIYGTKE